MFVDMEQLESAFINLFTDVMKVNLKVFGHFMIDGVCSNVVAALLSQ